MRYRKLPNTEARPVSEIGLGLWTLTTGWWGTESDGEAVRLIWGAWRHGINFFDAADSHGNGRSEEWLGRTLPSVRDQKVLSRLPNIYNLEQLREFAAVGNSPPLSDAEIHAVDSLIEKNFGVKKSAPLKLKGTMES